jgi:transposase
MRRSIGIDLGVTSSSRIAVADGVTILSNRRVRSTPEALMSAIEHASDGQPVDIVVESTAMSWFVAGVAAERSGVLHTLYRVNGRKAAALRSFYRVHTKTDRIDAPVLARMPRVDDALHEFTLPTASELALKRLVTFRQRLQKESLKAVSRVRSLLHWAAPRLLHAASGTSDGLLRILRRWPDLRKLASAHATTIASEGGMSPEQARDLRQCARHAVAFYGEHVDYALLALEIDVGLTHHASLQQHLARLDETIDSEYRRAYPNDVLRSIPGVGPIVGSVVRASVGDARNFKNASAFRAYTGLVPREDSSGDAKRRGRVSKAGPNLLRWALYLAADTARKHDPQLADLYRRLMVERGRHHNQALCAVATHLADRIYALLRENRPYQPRALDGTTVDAAEAKRIASSLAVDPETRQRLRVLNKREEGPRRPASRQPKAPHGTMRPSANSVPEKAGVKPARGG